MRGWGRGMGEQVAFGCEVLFSAQRALEVRALVEGATGRPCPCKVGKACPLLPAQEQRLAQTA